MKGRFADPLNVGAFHLAKRLNASALPQLAGREILLADCNCRIS
jgi:hypothetical protein